MAIKYIARLLVVLASTGVALLTAEVTSSLWLKHAGTAVDHVSAILRPDVDLLWRQRENMQTHLWNSVPVQLNEYGFRDRPWQAIEKSILLLGPSSAFGWGVPQEETYAAIIEVASRRIVRNASQIGFASSQGVRLLEKGEISSQTPEVVIIAYGINDLDRFRFFGPFAGNDQAALNLKREEKFLDWTYNSSFLSVLRKASSVIRRSWNCTDLIEQPLRVEEDEFLQNMEKMAQWARAKGARPIFLTTAFHPKQAGLEIEGNSDNRFRRSSELVEAGKCREAITEHAAAMRLETKRIHAQNLNRNQKLRQLAQKLGVSVIDVESLLQSDSDFTDPVHFSPEGHQKIADELLNGPLATL